MKKKYYTYTYYVITVMFGMCTAFPGLTTMLAPEALCVGEIIGILNLEGVFHADKATSPFGIPAIWHHTFSYSIIYVIICMIILFYESCYMNL